jgi:hypothetical protein
MSIADTLKEQVATTRMVVDGTLGDISEDARVKIPGGTAHPIGATFAHQVMSEDFVVNMIIRGSTPLMMGAMAGKTGFSEPQPMPGASAEDVLAWANRVKIDWPVLMEYSNAVRASVDDYLAGASDEELSRKVAFGNMGEQPVSGVIGLICIVHPSNHIGEISALKGIYGGKGYPF